MKLLMTGPLLHLAKFTSEPSGFSNRFEVSKPSERSLRFCFANRYVAVVVDAFDYSEPNAGVITATNVQLALEKRRCYSAGFRVGSRFSISSLVLNRLYDRIRKPATPLYASYKKGMYALQVTSDDANTTCEILPKSDTVLAGDVCESFKNESRGCPVHDFLEKAVPLMKSTESSSLSIQAGRMASLFRCLGKFAAGIQGDDRDSHSFGIAEYTTGNVKFLVMRTTVSPPDLSDPDYEVHVFAVPGNTDVLMPKTFDLTKPPVDMQDSTEGC